MQAMLYAVVAVTLCVFLQVASYVLMFKLLRLRDRRIETLNDLLDGEIARNASLLDDNERLIDECKGLHDKNGTLAGTAATLRMQLERRDRGSRN